MKQFLGVIREHKLCWKLRAEYMKKKTSISFDRLYRTRDIAYYEMANILIYMFCFFNLTALCHFFSIPQKTFKDQDAPLTLVKSLFLDARAFLVPASLKAAPACKRMAKFMTVKAHC